MHVFMYACPRNEWQVRKYGQVSIKHACMHTHIDAYMYVCIYLCTYAYMLMLTYRYFPEYSLHVQVLYRPRAPWGMYICLHTYADIRYSLHLQVLYRPWVCEAVHQSCQVSACACALTTAEPKYIIVICWYICVSVCQSCCSPKLSSECLAPVFQPIQH